MRSTFMVGGLVGVSLLVLAACHMPPPAESGSGGSPSESTAPSGSPSAGGLDSGSVVRPGAGVVASGAVSPGGVVAPGEGVLLVPSEGGVP